MRHEKNARSSNLFYKDYVKLSLFIKLVIIIFIANTEPSNQYWIWSNTQNVLLKLI